MAQNFRRYVARQVGTSAVTLFTADSFDTIVGIALANITDSECSRTNFDLIFRFLAKSE